MCKLRYLFLFLIAATSETFAQNASLSGRVTDQSGAIIINATVQATNAATGVSHSTVTTTAGYYAIADLAPGVYNLTASANGFEAQAQAGVTLAVQQSARLDFTLTVGGSATTVTVESNNVFLSTEDSTIGAVVDNQRTVDLPLVSRQFLEFAQLGTGVNTGRPGTYNASQQGIAISANGLYAYNNNFILDGADNNESYQNQFVISPSVDAVAEFKTMTGLYPAEYGRAGGAVVSIVTKSGTNEFHGVAFEFLRNNIFDARNYFSQTANPPLRRNQFGGSFGGPIRKNRAFFFVNYDGTRQSSSVTRNEVVPTAAERGGDLSAIGNIKDPANGGAPFSGNVIPANRISPISTALLAYWPLPNEPVGATYNYYANLSSTSNVDSGIVRVDYNLTQKDTLMTRFGISNSNSFAPGNFTLPVGGRYSPGGSDGDVITWTHVFSPTVVNVVSASYNRFIQNGVGQSNGKPLASNAGITGIDTNPQLAGFVEGVTFSTGTGFAGQGESSPTFRYMTTYQYQNSTSIAWKSHNIKFGGEFRPVQANILQTSGIEGNFTFNGQYTGNGFGDFLLGVPSATTTTLDAGLVHARRKSFALYVQDDWKLTPRLTVNMGFRWEYNTPATDAGNRLSAFDYATGAVVFTKNANLGNFYTSIRPDIPYERVSGNTLYPPYYHDFGPRLGISWQPFGPRTVFRAGGGLFYQSAELDAIQNTGNTPPFQIQVAGTGNLGTPNLSWALSTDPSTQQYGIFTFAKNYPYNKDAGVIDGRINEWMLEVQHELGKDWVAKVGYVGNHGNNLDTHLSTNDLPPGPGAASTRRIFNQWARIRSFQSGGWSSYNALQASLEKRFSNGLTVYTGYTYSKNMDFGWMVDICCEQDQNNLAAEKGLSGQDQKHHFGANAIYELPFGRGKWLGQNVNAVTNEIIGGWRLSTLMTFASGFPQDPAISSNRDNVPDNTDRPNRVGNGNISHHTINQWYDKTAFVAQSLYTFGNSGRNVLIEPGTHTANLSLAKTWGIYESTRLEFRWEMFNFTNTPNWGQPVVDIANTNFGRISSANAPRQMQFGLKLYF